MKKLTKMKKNTKTLTFLNMIAAKKMKNYKNIPKMTRNDKNIDIFEYDCSENNEQLKKMTKNDKNIDIFEYDCSENNEKI